MPRRIADYASTAGWNDLNLAATIGGFMIAASMIPLLWNIFVSLRSGKPAGDDPWEANTLEWATLAAAALQLRPPAGDPLRAAALRCSATAGRPGTEGTSDDDHHAGPTRREHSPVAGLPHDRRGGISNPSSGCCCSSPRR